MADPDLELRERGMGAGFALLALLATLPSVISFFVYQYRGEGPGPPPLDPPLLPVYFIWETLAPPAAGGKTTT